MKVKLILLVVGLMIVPLGLSFSALAQRDGYNGQAVYCSSDDGRRKYCQADTRGGVSLVRQRSGSPCEQGRTWDYDRNGIWVDRGCRADFQVGRGGGGGEGGGGGGGQEVYCASDDGRRNYCQADTRRGVTLVRQRSGSQCIEGRTWGYNRDGIWVDRGCRADFQVGRGGGGGEGGGGGGGGNRPNGNARYSGPIINRHSSKGLDVTNQSTRDGANVQQWDYAGQSNQNWDVIDVGRGEYAIINQNSGLALTVQGGQDRNAANIIQRRWRDNPQQRWRIDQVGGDFYRICSAESGRCLDVSGGSRDNGANVQQWDYANQANQQWRLGRR